MSTHQNKTIQQICDEDTGDSSLITNLIRRGKELEEEIAANRKLIGNIHERIEDIRDSLLEGDAGTGADTDEIIRHLLSITKQ